jgi:hypothetical protein
MERVFPFSPITRRLFFGGNLKYGKKFCYRWVEFVLVGSATLHMLLSMSDYFQMMRVKDLDFSGICGINEFPGLSLSCRANQASRLI